jgi:uncharacterized membrane protein YdjX (TVP38/TMEM64 family)
LVAFFALGLERYLSIDALRQHRSVLRAWVETSGRFAALVFMAVYIVTVAFSLPGATVLSIAGGFLFGAVWGTVLVIISATLVPPYSLASRRRPWAMSSALKSERGYRGWKQDLEHMP